MSQAGRFTSGGGGGTVSTLTGDIGVATAAASNINVITGLATTNSGSSIEFTGSGDTLELNVTDSDHNTLIGKDAGNLALSGTDNTGLGDTVLNALTSGVGNVAVGELALSGITSGTDNIAIGTSAGSAYTSTESNNISIGNTGTIADSGAIRIGTNASQTSAYMAGIAGVTVANTELVTINNVTGQLGSTATGGFIQQLAGNTGTASGSTVNVIASTAQGTSLITGDNVSTLTLTYTDADFNTVVGTSAFVATHTPAVAVANTGLGASNLNSITTGSGNSAIGFNAGTSLLDGINNTIVGTNAMGSSTSANTNTALGISALTGLLTGSNNTAVGSGAGSNYAGAESDNILIGNLGVLAESAVIRIGTTGTQTSAYMAGVASVVVANKNYVTINTVTGELGSDTGSSPSIAGSSFNAVLTGTQSLSSGDNTIIFDTLTVNNGGGYDNTTGIYTVPATGLWRINSTIDSTGAGGTLHLRVSINGTDYTNISIGGTPIEQVDITTNLTIGDTVEIKLNATGGSITGSGIPYITWFEMEQLTGGANPSLGIGTLDGDTGSATGSTVTISGGSTGLTTTASGTTVDLTGTLAIANGGTNATSMSTSTGIVKYDGTRLVTSSTAKIDSSNIMTNTSQPAFFAYLDSSPTNVTGDGTSYQLACNNVLFDNGSNYNNSTYTFTAPVTGVYIFSIGVLFQNTVTANTGVIQGAFTGITYTYGNTGGMPGSGNNPLNVLWPKQMTAGDTATAYVNCGGGSKTVGVYGGVGDPRTWFSGYLVC
jgi:hypothetical protein